MVHGVYNGLKSRMEITIFLETSEAGLGGHTGRTIRLCAKLQIEQRWKLSATRTGITLSKPKAANCLNTQPKVIVIRGGRGEIRSIGGIGPEIETTMVNNITSLCTSKTLPMASPEVLF